MDSSTNSKYYDMESERLVQLFSSLLGTTSSEQNPLLSSRQLPTTTAFELLSPAAATNSRVSSSVAGVSKASFLELLAKEPTTLCTIPSFDICSENDEDLFQKQVSKDPSMPPPATVVRAQQSGDALSNSINIPEMKASVFDSILPPGFEIPFSSKPSSTLDLKKCTQQTDESANGISDKAAAAAAVATIPTNYLPYNNEPVEIDGPTIDRGASNMAEPITWTRSSCTQIPMAVVRSLSSSFSSLVDYQMKATSLLLLKQSLASASPHARSRLLTVLSPSSSIRIHSITTSFDATSTSTETMPNLSSTTDQFQLQPQQPQENLAVAVVTLPLIFRATVTIMVGPQTQRLVTLRTTGKIKGSFKNKASYLLSGIDVSVDTYALLTTMVEEARQIVAQVVAAASAPPPPTPNKIQTFSNPNASLKFPTLTNLSSLLKKPLSNSAPATIDTASTNANSSFPAKISLQSFASLKLYDRLRNSDGISSNNKCQTTKTSRESSEALTLERNRMPTARSVTWNPSVKDPTDQNSKGGSNKRRKIMELQPQLLSSKSFGKPHASLFESNRNATFAEFGRAEQTCANYLVTSKPTTVGGHSQGNSLFRVATTTNISTDFMQKNYSSTSFSDRHLSKRNDLLASFTAASQQQQSTNQILSASNSNNCMDFSDLRGFIGDALGAPSFEKPRQQSPSPQTNNTSAGKP